jgi:hypothetical protein
MKAKNQKKRTAMDRQMEYLCMMQVWLNVLPKQWKYAVDQIVQ